MPWLWATALRVKNKMAQKNELQSPLERIIWVKIKD